MTRNINATSRAPETPPVAGVSANARTIDHFSSRSGSKPAAEITPLLRPTTTDTFSLGNRWAWLNAASVGDFSCAASQVCLDSKTPVKQLTRSTPPGAVTVTFALSIGMSQPLPIAFQ